jgi:hypothetical protein
MPWIQHKADPLEGARYDTVVDACEAARGMVPQCWSGDQANFDIASDDCCWGMAPFVFGEASKELAMPAVFWRHLVSAAEALGSNELAAEYPARLTA